MKIVEICPYDMARPGGVQTHVRDLAAWLRGRGHEVLVIAPRTRMQITQPGLIGVGTARSIGFQGSHFEISLASPMEIARVRRKLAVFGAEIVHLHTPWTPLVAWQVWHALGLPSVATFHATIPERDSASRGSALLFRAARYFMQRVETTIVPSTAPLAALERHAKGANIMVIPPAISLDDWRLAGEKRPLLRTGDISVLCLGRLEERKGIDTLLAAWASIMMLRPEVHLTIAGAGVLEGRVSAAAKNSHGRITFIHQPDNATAQALAAKADLLIAPAEYGESFGLVLLEAMAAGAVPIAAANKGYATVMTGKGQNLLVPPGDAAALVASVTALADDADQRARFQTWGRDHAARYDIDEIGPEFEAVFQHALKRQR